ncbi:MAG: FIG00789322: hypothetical protein [uncultured Truepera sp.]|uniref:Dessication-associated protein n=1 Tax=uncultured Truepera sp. TaxID=543023 RepID=A0A6J4VG13_9DEIN|nr:MAG: FIG00789322: hypothetical protein [uncultured Truepera sp.]
MDYQKLFKNKLDRRRLLGNLGMMGAGAVITACGGAAVGQPNPNPNPEPEPTTDLDPAILNFALNLEYLEAAFYLAAVGRIDEINTVGGDAEIILPEGFDGSTSIEFTTPEIASYADEIASDELAHVNFLRTALGASAADRPVLDLGPAFVAAATAAFPDVDPALTAQFNPFANELFFLHGAFIFEDVGVTAYSGAAPAITDKTTVLAKAAGILAVESYHAGEIRTLLYAQRETQTPFGVPVADVVAGISALRASVGGGKDEGIVNEDGSANIVPTDDDGIAFARTPREVANIVFLAADATTGGFFPEGLAFPADLVDDLNTLLGL